MASHFACLIIFLCILAMCLSLFVHILERRQYSPEPAVLKMSFLASLKCMPLMERLEGEWLSECENSLLSVAHKS